MRPRLLDLFCGPGGAAVGYARAGFDVVGVDIAPQPDYPYEFHQGDALEYLERHGGEFDAVHASPPCTEHTTLTTATPGRDDASGTFDLLRLTLDALAPYPHWVVENVMGARMPTHLILCGAMFGLRVYRHRRFAIGPGLPLVAAPPHPRHTVPAARGRRQAAWGRRAQPHRHRRRDQARTPPRSEVPGGDGHRLDTRRRHQPGHPTGVHAVHRGAAARGPPMTPPLSEAAWQGRVVDYAHRMGWWVLHFPDSRRATEAGWPDLTLIRDRLLLAELKTARGRVSPAQQRVHRMLRDVGVEIHVWRPKDWPHVMELLAREGR